MDFDEQNPVAWLRRTRPDLFDAPDFWQTTVDEIAGAARKVTRGTMRILGQSAGGLDIFSVAYGGREPQTPTATISSAMASDRPEAFFDPGRRSRPALILIGSIHGGETEGIATCLNLIEILERGADLRGTPHPQLAAQLEKMRLVIVPCLNPDGRQRAGVRHLNGAEIEHIFLVQQGVRQDGTLLKGRSVKETHPIPPGMLRFMGGYYNDNGVNLQHDDFFGPALAPENAAMQQLVRTEIPDGFLTLHAHGGHPALTAPDAYLAPGYQRRQAEVTYYILSRLTLNGHEVLDPARATGPPWSFYFQTYFAHACGALPLLCELPHGIAANPYPLAKTLDAGLLVVSTWIEFALRFGLRPNSPAFYAAPPPA